MLQVRYSSGGPTYSQDTVDIQCDQSLTNVTLSLNECNITSCYNCDGYFTHLTCGEQTNFNACNEIINTKRDINIMYALTFEFYNTQPFLLNRH